MQGNKIKITHKFSKIDKFFFIFKDLMTPWLSCEFEWETF